MASQTKSKNLDRIDPRALEHTRRVPRSSRVHANVRGLSRRAYADFEIDGADRDAGNRITIPMLVLWATPGIAAPPHASRCLEEMGDQWCRARRSTAGIFSGRESECDGEGVAGFFCGGLTSGARNTTRRHTAKAVSSTPRPIGQSPASLEYWIIAFADDDSCWVAITAAP